MNPCVLKRQTALNNKSCNATVVESKKCKFDRLLKRKTWFMMGFFLLLVANCAPQLATFKLTFVSSNLKRVTRTILCQ